MTNGAQTDRVKERSYKNRDVIKVSKEGLGDLYASKLKGFFRCAPAGLASSEGGKLTVAAAQ